MREGSRSPTTMRSAGCSGGWRCWSLRALDALHLASCAHLAEHGPTVLLASYDRGMIAVARAMEIPLFDLDGS